MLADPDAIRFDGFGNLYFPDWGNSRIRMLAADGTVHTVAGSATQGFGGDGGRATDAQLDLVDPSASSGLVFDNQGHLFISDLANDRVRKIT
jgi:hypothetical protein